MKNIRIAFLHVSIAPLLLVGIGCVGRTPSASVSVPATPTPSLLLRLNPNIVEEDETHIVERFPKKDYVKVDERHIRPEYLMTTVEFFKEDDEYYYVFTYKRLPDEIALKQMQLATTPVQANPAGPSPGGTSREEIVDIAPTRVKGGFQINEVTGSGLPSSGMWRHSFVLADMNGDGILDIVAPPARGGDTSLHVWLGDGKGHFAPWGLSFTEKGRHSGAGLTYGGVAVGDIDGDGNLDIVAASHGNGLTSFFGDGRGGFEVVHQGLPRTDFSAQAITLLDVDGDGKLDIVASRDNRGEGEQIDYNQVRAYLFRSPRQWEYQPDAVYGGFYSYTINGWDFDGDGRKDILIGAHYFGALSLIWRNQGNGTFSRVSFPEIEVPAVHPGTAPGRFGPRHLPAFADAYSLIESQPGAEASTTAEGISIYAFDGQTWTRHRVWRKRGANSFLYALAFGDLDGDGLDDILFADSELMRLRIFLQQTDGSFREVEERLEPVLDSPGQCIRLADLNGDGRPDIVLSKTFAAGSPGSRGGWNVWLNRP